MDNFDSMFEFSNIIFDRVAKYKLDHMDAIVSYCEESNLEIDSVVSLISPSLRLKVEEEAIATRQLKTSTIRLTF